MLFGGGITGGSGSVSTEALDIISPVKDSPFAGCPELRDMIEATGADVNSIVSCDIVIKNAKTTDVVYGAVLYFSVKTTDTEGNENYLSSMISIDDPDGMTVLRGDVLSLNAEGAHTVTVSAADMQKSFDINVKRQSLVQSKLILMNRVVGATQDYVAGTLGTNYGVDYVYGPGDDVSFLDEEALEHFYQMSEAAKAEGVYLYFLSGYRDYYTQEAIWLNAGGWASTDTAPPGNSEHQSGLCLDITWDDNRYALAEWMEDTNGFAWLSAHSWEYGFILRYTKGYEDITGYDYEPWHYRYIGVEAAREYRELGCRTFEEYVADKVF